MEYKKKLEDLLNVVINENASDLHISVGRKPTIRVSGMLISLEKENILKEEDTAGLMSVLVNEKEKNEFLKNKEIDFSYSYLETRFRCNCYFQKGTIAISMRLIPKKIRTLQELGLPQILESFADKQQGFFLVVGPVGHGKTTTLASMVEIINNTRSEHIITIEDPIEYLFEEKKCIIDQREVKIDTDDFHTALVSMFRQDVDVVMIGEMRGIETISTAVTAAETGHLVLSTLHTNNASQTIDRIIDSFPINGQTQIRTQLAGSLIGIFSQRLVPKISGGVVPAYELLINNNAVANLIREGRVHEIDSVIETSSESGMVDINRSLAELVRAGEITIDDARKYSIKVQGLEKLL